MDGRLAVGPAACGTGVDLNTYGWVRVAGIDWGTRRVGDAHGGDGGVVGHLWRRTNHWDATEGRAKGQKGRTSLGVRVAHVGGVGSCSGGLEGSARTLQPVSRGPVSVGAAQVQTGRHGAWGAQQGGAHSLGGHPAAAPHVPRRVADGLVVQVQPSGDV